MRWGTAACHDVRYPQSGLGRHRPRGRGLTALRPWIPGANLPSPDPSKNYSEGGTTCYVSPQTPRQILLAPRQGGPKAPGSQSHLCPGLPITLTAELCPHLEQGAASFPVIFSPDVHGYACRCSGRDTWTMSWSRDDVVWQSRHLPSVSLNIWQLKYLQGSWGRV